MDTNDYWLIALGIILAVGVVGLLFPQKTKWR